MRNDGGSSSGVTDATSSALAKTTAEMLTSYTAALSRTERTADEVTAEVSAMKVQLDAGIKALQRDAQASRQCAARSQFYNGTGCEAPAPAGGDPSKCGAATLGTTHRFDEVVRLCTAVQEMIAEDPKAAALTDEGETFAKYCDSHFQTSGASYGKFKHHFVKGHPMPEL